MLGNDAIKQMWQEVDQQAIPAAPMLVLMLLLRRMVMEEEGEGDAVHWILEGECDLRVIGIAPLIT